MGEALRKFQSFHMFRYRNDPSTFCFLQADMGAFYGERVASRSWELSFGEYERACKWVDDQHAAHCVKPGHGYEDGLPDFEVWTKLDDPTFFEVREKSEPSFETGSRMGNHPEFIDGMEYEDYVEEFGPPPD